ncbi:Poly(ADP-ribose) glycohydrolase 1 [Hordeum vulgare]|nr:Poly(ADP-ribose) glycohydrolase 1 [Hordeum vulgare]
MEGSGQLGEELRAWESSCGLPDMSDLTTNMSGRSPPPLPSPSPPRIRCGSCPPRTLLRALPARAVEGYALFFDDLLSRSHAWDWFSDVLPRLVRVLLRLPALLEDHYAAARAATGLRLLGPQDAGFVLLGQELVAALLACALFYLFPTAGRGEARLPAINFDALFSALTNNARQSQ